ncbi:MAG TPA: glycosyltransferase family 4 protein [Gemmatimonadaceae bacterium]|nr:glycosyltransferase family 4 protein [Gemmatimonadaceae bacterium]
MRVIYLHQYFNTPAMAGGTRSYEMARRLVQAGHDVHMITTWRERSDNTEWFITQEAGITVHWLPLAYSNHMRFAERVRIFMRFAFASARKAASLPGDVVFATSTPLTIAIPGMVAAFCKRVPMVFEVRDLWPDVPIAMGILRNPLAIRLAQWLERITYRRAARVVVVAPGMKEAVVRRGVAEEHVAVIPNGCDFDIFERGGEGPAIFPQSDRGVRTVLYLGTMGVANGVTYIPELAAALRRRTGFDPVQFYLMGDGQRRVEAEDCAQRLGVLGESVHFVGSLPKNEVGRWVGAADATIITYDGPEIVYRDSVSNKFFDSIAAGKPVLANYRGFATLTAAEAGAGWILARDVDTAAAELMLLIADPATFVNAGRCARALARARFGRDELAAQLERVLHSALADR